MNQLELIRGLTAYEVVEAKEVKEVQSQGMVLAHKKTGARLFLMSNTDENKVFCIGFRTPQKDDTGVPHIIEHSVLCGSDKFPLKDPFVELVKGSLNTFLNAMTYPDKTIYPVASCNEKDFQNLMDVYVDAVLHPNIYHEEKIFLQEGWHYELEGKDKPLTYNGVVYNEMKGAYSSPENVLERHILHTLFPDNCYGKDSGGDPSSIPELTYEGFLDFHGTYYHPSNSYIYLYGDMDMVEKLTWLDEEYLSKYEAKQVDSVIPKQTPFEAPIEDTIYYPVAEDDSEEDATYLSINTVVDVELDPKLTMAFNILEYTLLDAPGAPLKQALIDAGIGSDILGGYEGGIYQPYFSVIAKGANAEQKGEFLSVVKGMLYKLADQGINQKSLLAGINFYEFKSREADYGSAPKGLMYGIQSLDTWLYDGDPMLELEYEETFAYLKQELPNGYFENLIRTYLLDNPFEAVVIAKPKKNMTAMEDELVAKKLAEYKASLSETELDEMIANTKALKEYQDIPSTPEQMAKLPLLERKDIGKKAEEFYWKEYQFDGVTVLHHNFFTAGIGYLKLLFNTNVIDQEDLCYVGLLKSILGGMATEHYSYADLTSEIHLNSGGLDITSTAFANLENPEDFTGAVVASVRVLYDKLDFGFEMIEEILTRTLFTDDKRLKEIIQEARSRGKMKLEQAGHSTAVSRATSYFSPTAYFNEATAGTTYYRFLVDLAQNFDEKKEMVIAKLEEVSKQLFTKLNMLVNYTSDEAGFTSIEERVMAFAGALPVGTGEKKPFFHPVANKNEGLKTSSQVNYVARCGNFKTKGLEYTGALKILQVILSYDYLWLNLRVKGGAYGCMSGFGRSGEGYLVSYRDPNVKETNEVYEGIIGYLNAFDPDERDMTKYVIGTMSNVDAPLNPSAKGARGLSAYLSGVTAEMMQTERDQILTATAQDIRDLAPLLEAILETNSFCVVGNEEKIQANAELFLEISTL